MNRRSVIAILRVAMILAFGLNNIGESSAQTPSVAGAQLVITLGVVGPLTPSSKAFGIAHLQGITLAVDEYNHQHLDAKREIQLRVFDDKAEPAAGVAAVKSLEADAVAILGPANSGVTRNVISYLHSRNLQIPVVSALSTATSLTENLQLPSFFRANVSDQKRLSTLLELIFGDDNLKPRRMLAFYEKADAFGEGMLKDTRAWLRTNNRNFHDNSFSEIGYHRDISQEDATQLVSEARAKDFGAKNDGILLLGIASDAVTFTSSLRNRGVQSQIYFNEPDYSVFKSAADRGLPIGGLRVLSVYWPEGAIVNSFRSSFKKRFSEEPSFSAALAYDAARLVLRAVDIALVEQPSPSKNIQEFRKRIHNNLTDGKGETLDHILPGDHNFEKNEYRKINFQGLKYTSQGNLVQWDQTADEPQRLRTAGADTPILLPPYYCLLFVIVFSFVGSVIREFSRQPPKSIWQIPIRLSSPISLVLDPLIALITFGCIFLLTLITKRSLLEVGGDALLIYIVSSIALGSVAGFLGVRALFVVIRRFGIDIKEQELIGTVRNE